MTAFFRRLFGTRPTPPLRWGGVGVVDGTGTGIGASVSEDLASHGVPAKEVEAFDVTAGLDCVVLLLPARPIDLPIGAQHILSVLSALTADAARSVATPIVLSWYVAHDIRADLAAHRDDDGQPWNGAEVLLGSSWSRELRRHEGDESAAVVCRSDQVVRLMRGNSLSGKPVADLTRALTRLDPHHLHALSVQVREHEGDQVNYHWVGLSSVAAAVRARLIGGRPSGAATGSGPDLP